MVIISIGTVFLIFCIFQMVVLAIEIDIGSAAVNRASFLYPQTTVNKANPANATGTITSIEIWAKVDLVNCEVATFFVVSGNNLSTRDTVTIGAVTAGSKQTFTEDSGSDPISLNVEAGDYIGIWYTSGQLDKTDAGIGTWQESGDNIPCENQLFDTTSDDTISLYGTGETEEEEAEVNAIWFGTNF